MKRFLLSAAVAAMCLVLMAGALPVNAQSGNTWRIDYFNNPNWAGSPVMTQFSPWISFNWGLGSPGPAVPPDNFTARMTTDAFFYAGTYQFTVLADDEAVLIIDGVTRVDTRGQGLSGKQITVNLPMRQGNHRIEVLYREWTVSAYIFVNWFFLSGGTPPPAPPPGVPWLPSSQSSVRTQFGDYTPCIQQNIHQANCFVSDGAWNSPNLGSIQMEPQIASWNTCTPDITQEFLDNNAQVRSFNCSKTAAGWFPR